MTAIQDPSGVTAGYIPPEIGIDAVRTAVAAVRCALASDAAGLHVLLSETAIPVQLMGTLATITVNMCRRCGLADDAIMAMLTELRSSLENAVLDQPRPVTEAGDL